jgi:hypothetical protein
MDGEASEALLQGPGPLTLTAVELLLIRERLCDLDGDGEYDNVVADLGEPAATLFLTILNSSLVGSAQRPGRFLFHSPWIEDRGPPGDDDAVVIFFGGTAHDDAICPADPPGSDCYWADTASVDGCGEPLFAFPGTDIDEGRFAVTAEAVPLTLGAQLRATNAHVAATIGEGGSGAEMEMCCAFAARDLGGVDNEELVPGMSMLEAMLAGGAAFGLAGVPGVQPDVDLDGDGLEHINLDQSFAIESCIDGGGTVIAGAGCWQDERIADGFSGNLRMSLVPARFGGLLRDPLPGECLDPPGESLWEAR